MSKNYKKRIFIFLIIIVLILSVITASAIDERPSKSNFLYDEDEFENPLINALDIKKERENGKGGEEISTPLINMENNLKDTDGVYQDSLIILGNLANKDGSNGIIKQPLLTILIIISLLTIIMVYITKRK